MVIIIIDKGAKEAAKIREGFGLSVRLKILSVKTVSYVFQKHKYSFFLI